MTHFNSKQVAFIHEANEQFKAKLAAGKQGQIIDDTTPERKLQMQNFISMSDESKAALADNWSLFLIKKVICGAEYYHTFADISIKDHLLSLPWETKRTARHELFLSDKELSYSYGGRAACPYCSNGCEKCNYQGYTRPSYSAKKLTEPTRNLMNRLNACLGTEFNAIFLNKYDNESQHLGWHADDFEGMRQDQPIAVISFGAEREIWMKDKRGFKCKSCEDIRLFADCNCRDCYNGWTAAPPNAKQPLDQRVKLQEGSLFIMPVGYQDMYLHRIPKHDRPCGWRISLTFRSFK